MALIQITCASDEALSQGADSVPKDRPVVILLHGYNYEPGSGLCCPHASLYAKASDHPAIRSRDWPTRLNVGTREMSAIGFGWPARGSLWGAWRAANMAGHALARLISDLKAAAPERDIHILAHSMGARVAMAGLKAADRGVVRRVILLNGADFISHVSLALQRQARSVSLFNVTSRENAVFDALVELSLADTWIGDKSVGRGIDAPRAVTLRLDQRQHLSTLNRLGFDLPAPNKRICHWSTYLRPGTGALYRGILDGNVRFSTLKRALRPVEPRLMPFALPKEFWRLNASARANGSVGGKAFAATE